MAQYYLSASEADPISRLTARFGCSISVVDDSGTTAIELGKDSNLDIEIATLDEADGAGTVEVVARGRSTDTQNNESFGVVARFDASQNGYGAHDEGSHSSRMTRYDAALRTLIGETDFVVTDVTAYHWVRFQLSGSALKVRHWDGDPGDEPGTWDSEVTDANFSTGFVGFGSWRYDVYLTDLGVGTGGDPAPTSAVGGGPTTGAKSPFNPRNPLAGPIH